MPSAAVQTDEDLIRDEDAKRITAAADMEGTSGCIMDRMKKQRSAEIAMGDIVLEDRDTVGGGFDECIYGGADTDLTWDHLIPTSEGGPEVISNRVPACQSCNPSKGGRDAIEWYRQRDTSIPRIVRGKYLKLKHDTFAEEGRPERNLPAEERDQWTGLDVDRSETFG